MPTISQLTPAVAATDSDELIVNQDGVTKKLTRTQLLTGVQPALTPANGTLLGRYSKNAGPPESIAIGSNLILSTGTLSGMNNSYVVAEQPSGIVPSGGDLVAVSQDGKNAAVTYRQFMSGLTTVPNVDISQTLVTPTGSSVSSTIADLIGSSVQVAGATMTGYLSLDVAPSSPSHAATKAYVDERVSEVVPRSGTTMTGSLSLYGSPVLPAHAVNKSYADSIAASAVGLGGATMSGPLVLNADPTMVLQAATKQYVDVRLQRAGDSMTGMLTLASDPSSAAHAATKRYVDTQVATALPKVGGTLTGSLALSSEPTTPLHAASKQYVDSRLVRGGDTMTGPLVLVGDPTGSLQAATKSYVDSQTSKALQRTGGTLTGPLVLSAEPAADDQVATKRYVDSKTGVALLSGGTMLGSLVLASNPTTDLQAATKAYVDLSVGASLRLTGGTLSGALSLATAPTDISHAVNKQYVDANPGRDLVINVSLPPYGAKLDGVTDDTAAFKAAYQSAPTGATIYVPNGTAFIQSPNSWGIDLTKRVKWVVAGTLTRTGSFLSDAIPAGTVPSGFGLPGVVVGHSKQGASVSLGRSDATDFSAFHTSYVVNHQGGQPTVIANNRSDTIIYSTPANFVWGGVDRVVWAGVGTPDASAPAQHVGRYVQTIRQTIATDSSGVPYSQPELWTACLEYRDVTGKPSSWANDSLVVEMDWIGNGPDDARSRQIQSLVVAQHDKNGEPVEVSNIIGVYLATGSSGHVNKVFNVGIPFATAVLDTTASQQLSGASAIRLAAGHSIAFDASGNNRLAFDSATNALRWYQGILSFAVGKGISVGWQTVFSANASLDSYLAGNIVFLVGGNPYTITLPAANKVAAGTGFTFSVLGTGSVSIVPKGTDLIDLSPVMLRQYDRYHIVSDGNTTWREVFRCNTINPRFGGPPVLPSYAVAHLPVSVVAGAKAFATDGRKPSEAAGSGTGVEVFYDGIRWISGCTGTPVTA